MNQRRRFPWTVFLTLVALISSHAFAALGEDQNSIEKDRRKIHAGKHSQRKKGSYTIHELTKEGMTIREFADGDGQIFAVTWEGVRHPGLQDLLNSYYGEYASASREQVKARGHGAHSAVQSRNLVVEKYGHMRAARGRAYLPGKLPAGVSVDELQ